MSCKTLADFCKMFGERYKGYQTFRNRTQGVNIVEIDKRDAAKRVAFLPLPSTRLVEMDFAEAELRALSSVGQSISLTPRGSRVRTTQRPPVDKK